MTPEEMSDPKRSNGHNMKQYINSIRYASCIPVEEPETPIKLPEIGNQIEISTEKECTASGSGLVVAVVDKRARFNITTQTYKYKNLYVEITGPNREKVRRKILTSKVGRGCLTNANSSQSSKDEPLPEDEGPPEPIPLDYQVIKLGSYQVNYIPRSLGNYQVAITWGGEHIKNSPFKVRSTTAKNIEQTTVKGVVKAVSFQDEQDSMMEQVAMEQFDNEGNSIKSRRQSLFRQAHISNIRDSYASTSTSPFSSMCSSMVSSMDHSIDNASDVFLPGHSHFSGNHPFFMSRHGSSVSTASSRSGSILSRSSSIMYSTDRPPAVKTRRKVIRRIIKGAGGTEEVTYPNLRSSSILSSSQMSSIASTPSISMSMSIDDRSPKFSTSSSSSGASASFANPSITKVISPPAKYADHMSKIIIGEALKEISKQVSINLNANRRTKDGQRVGEDDDLMVKRSPENMNYSDNSIFKLQPNISLKQPSPSVVGTASKTSNRQDNKQEQSRHSVKQSENSADLEQYLQTRKQFLQEIGNDCRSGDSKCSKASKTNDTAAEAPSKNPGTSTSAKCTEMPGHFRRAYKKRKEDKATQCTAHDIKTATGWISRRSVYRNAHVNNRQKDSNGDSALGESEGSATNSSSDKDTAVQAKFSKINRRPADVQLVHGSAHPLGDDDKPVRQYAVGVPVQRRGFSGIHSSHGRQSTFDSGFSDENCQFSGHENRRNPDEMRGRRRVLMTTGKKVENVASAPVTQSSPLRDDHGKDIVFNPNMSTAEGYIKWDEITATQPTYEKSQETESALPIEILHDNPGTKSTSLKTDSDDMINNFPNHKNENEDLVLRQYLTVDNAYLNSSTAPTPGGSSVGNISSPEDDDVSAEGKSNISSDIPEEKYLSLFGNTSGRNPPNGNETLTERSLDAILRTLENDPEYSTREFLLKYRPVLGDDLGILDQLTTNEPVHNMQELHQEKWDVSSKHNNGTPTKDDSIPTPSQPMPERCYASGLGLYNGIVGDKNNFQVSCQSLQLFQTRHVTKLMLLVNDYSLFYEFLVFEFDTEIRPRSRQSGL